MERLERQPEMYREVPKILCQGPRITDTYNAQEDQRGWLIRARCHRPVMPGLEWLRPGLQEGRGRGMTWPTLL